jgi:hypothetical protein
MSPTEVMPHIAKNVQSGWEAAFTKLEYVLTESASLTGR